MEGRGVQALEDATDDGLRRSQGMGLRRERLRAGGDPALRQEVPVPLLGSQVRLPDLDMHHFPLR